MKKIFTILLVIVMLVGLVACGETDNKEDIQSSVDEEIENNTESPEVTEDEENLPESDEDDKTDNSVESGNVQEPDETQEDGAGANEPSTGANSDSSGQSEPPVNSPDPVTPPAEQETPDNSGTADDNTASESDMSLSEIMAQLNQFDEEMPVLMDTQLSAEEYPYNVFIDYIEGSEALMSSPMIGSIAHCVVLLRLPDGTDVDEVAEQIKANADPRKWICVEAEAVEVRTAGNIVLLVMSSQTTADKVVSNFEALAL